MHYDSYLHASPFVPPLLAFTRGPENPRGFSSPPSISVAHSEQVTRASCGMQRELPEASL